MAQGELLGSENLLDMLGIDLNTSSQFLQMTPSEQLYVGAYAVSVAKNDSWLANGETGREDFFGSDLIVPGDVDEQLQGSAHQIRKTLAEERLLLAELAFHRLATDIFANNVMVLNGVSRTNLLQPKTNELFDVSKEPIEFIDREFVEIVPGKRTHERSPLSVVMARNTQYPHFGSNFYATYYAGSKYDERNWMSDHRSLGFTAALEISTHPGHFKPDGDADPLIWHADRPLHVPRQHKPRS